MVLWEIKVKEMFMILLGEIKKIYIKIFKVTEEILILTDLEGVVQKKIFMQILEIFMIKNMQLKKKGRIYI